MDALFANSLGESALVQTRQCEDPVKGKGVFSLLPLGVGVVAMRDFPVAWCTSHELSSLALEDPAEALPVPHKTCATCSGFVGTLHTQLGALLEARNALRPVSELAKGKGATKATKSDGSPPSVKNVPLPKSQSQPTTLKPTISSKDNKVYCSKQCASAPEQKMQNANNTSWAKFSASLGEIPRADRRSLLLAARMLSGAVAGGPKSNPCEAARLIQSDYIWQLLDRDADAEQGVREALTAAWPDLLGALVAAHGAAAVTKCERVFLAGFEGSGAKPGLATFEGYAALCGAAQRNGMSVKIPNPLTRYVASTPEAGAAPFPLKPAVKWLLAQVDLRNAQRVAEEERAVFGGGGDDDEDESDDDDDSDSDDELELGDEQITIDWGHDCRFECVGLFPAARGAAVFPLASGLNHSCSPNCEIAYVDDNAVIVVTTRAVTLGEEMTISYVDTQGTDDERREELSEVYGFECGCERCGVRDTKPAGKATPAKAAKKATPVKKATPSKKATPKTVKTTTPKAAKKATPTKKTTPKAAAKKTSVALTNVPAEKTPVAKKTPGAKTPTAKRKAASTETNASAAKKPRSATK